MRNLISAIQFLTILPLGKPGIFDPKKMIRFFPIVGILLGILLAVFDQAVIRLWPRPVAALLDVIFLVAATGAFHLDGLADTADGLYGQRPREKALEIMKDSRIGVMGLIAVLCGLSIKWGGISNLDNHRCLLLIMIPAYARAGMMFGIRFLEYGRPEGGTGQPFFGSIQAPYDFWGVLFPIALSLFLGWKGLWLNVIFVILIVLILSYYKKRIGGITGDMLGAMSEMIESLLFLLASIGAVS
jgi:adenosylcobinamide-GDP ribazoletransferase